MPSLTEVKVQLVQLADSYFDFFSGLTQRDARGRQGPLPSDSEALEFSPTCYKLTTLNQIKCKPNSFCGIILQNTPQSLKRINFISFFLIKFLTKMNT